MIAGIDLGTTNSLIGVMDSGFPVLIADEAGERLTPSVVHFPADGAPLVGRAAARFRALRPAQTVSSIKRFMGRRPPEDSAVSASPEEISSLILLKLKRDAERAMEQTISRAVITVPAYFNDAQRQATKRAGELAGFTVERIVNEPTAAALAYGLDKLTEKSRIAVFDLGGGTFDITLLELDNGVFHVLATHGNTRLGGDDIDNALMELLLRGAPAGGDPMFLARLREAAVEAKHRLSEADEARIELPFAGDAGNFSHLLTRSELESVVRPLVERTREHCLRALADARLAPRDLDQVVLAGGVTRMPFVRRFTEEIFLRPPNTTQNPDEVVALGATIQAGILEGALQNMVLLDVTPLSLGIETFGGLMNTIIPRNSTIPLKAGEMFTNALPNQASMRITVLQGEREMAGDNWPLGQFELDFDAAPKGQARVGVQFEIDASGILHVLARDTKTGLEKTVAIQSAVDVSDEAVEKMIADSVENAFEDMNERILTETRLKATEILAALAHAFAIAGPALPDAEKLHIETLAEEVRNAMDTGELSRLKKATAALDEGTQHLATLLVEQAMAAAVKR